MQETRSESPGRRIKETQNLISGFKRRLLFNLDDPGSDDEDADDFTRNNTSIIKLKETAE